MKNYFFIIPLALSAMLFSCNKPTEQTVVSEEKTEVAPPSNALQTLRMAYDLARYGYETESAMALIEAADIIASVPTEEMDRVSVEKGSEASLGDKADKAPITLESLLADAREFAGDNEHLLALIADVERKLAAASEVTRGPMPGPDAPIEHHDRVFANSYDLYKMILRAGVTAEIAVLGDGDTDLDLYVYDEEANLVASDIGNSATCYVNFVPCHTGTYIIKIVNTGAVYNNYVLLTN